MSDLYQILGLSKNATASEIKKAYHKIARTTHPDVAKNDAKAADTFKKASAAYEILSDSKKRAQYDAGEIDDEGKPRSPFGAGFSSNPYGGYSSAQNGNSYYYQSTNGFDGFNFADLFGGGAGGFADIFSSMNQNAGRRNSRSYQTERNSAQNMSYSLTIPFILAMTGGESSVRLSSGKQIKVKIPAGITDGTTLRLKGQGIDGGDAMIKISIENHPLFTRNSNDVQLVLPITLKEAVLGAKVTIPTLTGKVALTIPPNTSSDKILRLKGKGATGKGDLLVRIQILLPDKPDKDLEDFVRSWKPASQNPRPFF